MSGEKTYQWDSPHDWLADAAREWTPQRLFSELMNLACLLDGDDIQAEFQDEMAADGYFTAAGEGGEGVWRCPDFADHDELTPNALGPCECGAIKEFLPEREDS